MKIPRTAFLWLLLSGCTGSNDNNMNEGNRLSNSKSPYLLQHADNPVDWYPWGEEALQKAKDEDKPILVSIGYSSCHWCHVMAHESFEDDSVAEIMNAHFVNIKIDREERPDIDQVYMDAVQTMGLRGGWPLNVFLTPDQKPFYGGTYFPKEGWTRLLYSVNDAFLNNRQKLEESAQEFTAALNRNASARYYMSPETKITLADLDRTYKHLTERYDLTWGGMKEAPKFPSPALWASLNTWSYVSRQPAYEDHFLLTIDKMYQGGIYDHIGGGFARYSTDGEWHVPHFEKMLYDNGQLLSLYAHGYRINEDPVYLRVMSETLTWLQREMRDPETGGFYAALDADSEGEEGKFYVWDLPSFTELAGEASWLIDYYDVSGKGNWEGKNVLRILESDINKVDDYSDAQLDDFKVSALEHREQRTRPGLDNKLISGWNALTLTGLLDAYQATGSAQFLTSAREIYGFITSELIQDDALLHIYGLETNGFADDYAAVIQSLIKYYETTFQEDALFQADRLVSHMDQNFFDPEEEMYFYTSDNSEDLIARKKEMMDNVIPASNSIMAENLLKLGLHLDKEAYRIKSLDMVNAVSDLIGKDISFMANWAHVSMLHLNALPEIAIVGPEALEFATEFNKINIPVKVISATVEESDLPLLEFKTAMKGATTIYVCFNKACKKPVHQISEALELIPR